MPDTIQPKATYLFLLLFFTSFPVLAQRVRIHFDMNMDTVELKQFEFTDLGKTETYFRMNYGKSSISNPGAIRYLEGKIIDTITLVYTDYPVEEDLTELSQRRIAQLYSFIPEVFSNPFIHWRLVKQTGCTSQDDAFNFFHGFAIRYHNAPTAASIALEANYIKNVLEGKSELTDSTLFRVFNRHKEKWKSALVVSDLTGSMSPYAAQLLLWFKLNQDSKMFRHLTFFNDGDAKETEEKKIGKTGGIYHGSSMRWDTLAPIAYASMQNGYGGDGPENDIEGIIAGIEKCNTCTEVLLIADNYSTVRDLKLLKRIKKPVNVILCGSYAEGEMKVNIQYLELAYKTGGTIHTIEEDLEELARMREGEVIEFAGHLYKIEKGRFKYLGEQKKA